MSGITIKVEGDGKKTPPRASITKQQSRQYCNADDQEPCLSKTDYSPNNEEGVTTDQPPAAANLEFRPDTPWLDEVEPRLSNPVSEIPDVTTSIANRDPETVQPHNEENKHSGFASTANKTHNADELAHGPSVSAVALQSEEINARNNASLNGNAGRLKCEPDVLQRGAQSEDAEATKKAQALTVSTLGSKSEHSAPEDAFGSWNFCNSGTGPTDKQEIFEVTPAIVKREQQRIEQYVEGCGLSGIAGNDNKKHTTAESTMEPSGDPTALSVLSAAPNSTNSSNPAISTDVNTTFDGTQAVVKREPEPLEYRIEDSEQPDSAALEHSSQPKGGGHSDDAGTSNQTQSTTEPPAPVARIRVKRELYENNAANENQDIAPLSDDFFVDILTPSLPVKEEKIPEQFWDDIPEDQVREHIAAAEEQELEEKYSERLKQWERLNEKELRQRRKKSKKSKKKSRKRSHSRERSRDRSLSPLPSKRPRTAESHSRPNQTYLDEAVPSSSAPQVLSAIDEDSQPDFPAIDPQLPPKHRIERITARAKMLISYLEKLDEKENSQMTSFLFTSAVRKLPASQSCEKRSLLQSITNVSYRFNSRGSHFKYHKWGLARLPSVSAKLAKQIGYDAEAVFEKLKVIKIPAELRNLKQEATDEEDKEPMRSSLFSHVATQTDDVVIATTEKGPCHEIAVQATPNAYEIGCQTLETMSPSMSDSDLPIMRIIQNFNDNQMIALHDFAELITESVSTSVDMYRLRQRMLDIYRTSQLPPTLVSEQPMAPSRFATMGSFSNANVFHAPHSVFKTESECTVDPYMGPSNRHSNPVYYKRRERDENPHNAHRDDVYHSSNSRRKQAAPAEYVPQSKYFGRGGLRR